MGLGSTAALTFCLRRAIPGVMTSLPPLSLSIIFALALSVAMTVVGLTLLFTHDRKQEDLEQWVDFSFSRETLRQALGYYRLLGYSMAAAYILFVISCLHLQWDGYQIFAENNQPGAKPIWANPIVVMIFALDLVLRGGFFDFMQHFDVGVSHAWMNRKAWGFVWYAFIFRMFFGLTLLRIIISFIWIYGKIRRMKEVSKGMEKDGSYWRPSDSK